MKINVIKQKIEPDNIGLKPNKFYYCDYYGGVDFVVKKITLKKK